MTEATTAFNVARERALQDPLHAFISVVDGNLPLPTAASGTGPLAGMPFAVKDNIDTVALPTTANTPALVGSLRHKDNPVVERLTAAGALLVGKTNTHELASGGVTSAAAFPATGNPFDAARSPGGSSGGSAAAVGSGIVPFALATDTGGSSTVPAAMCGVYGYRPSVGRWPGGGTVPLSNTRDTVGVIARSLRLVQQVDEAVRDSVGVAVRPAVVRLAIPDAESEYLRELGSDVRRVWDAVLAKLRASTAVELVEVPTGRIHELDAQCGMGIVLYETYRDLSAYLAELPTPVTFIEVMEQSAAADVKEILHACYEQRDAHDSYLELLEVRRELQDEWDRILQGNQASALLRPTTPITAVLKVEDRTTHALGYETATFPAVVRNTAPGATAGQPSLSIPAGVGSLGLPVGVSLDGIRDGDDELLLAAELVDQLIGVRSPLL